MTAAATDGLQAIRARHLELLVRGDRHTALREAAKLVEDGMPLERFVLGVLAPVQAQVGLRWQRGELSTTQERMATEVAEILLTLAAARRVPADDGAHLAMCVADREHHNLPARMVAELLRDLGHRVAFLGTPGPRSGLQELLARVRPDALVVSCSLAMNLPDIRRLTGIAHEAGIPVVCGGAAFAGVAPRARRRGGDALATLVGEVGDRAASAAGSPLTPAADDERALQHDDLAASRLPLTAELTDRMLWHATPLLPRNLRTARALRGHVANLMRFIETATLVDDAVLGDYAAWLAGRMQALRADPAAVPTLLHIARERLAPDTPAAAVALDGALASLRTAA